jgi:subtilisin family serine protease
VTTSTYSGSRTRRAAIAGVLALALLATWGAVDAAAAPHETADASRSSWPHGTVVIGFRSDKALDAALRRLGGRVLERLPALRTAVVRPSGSPARFARLASTLPGIAYVQPLRARRAAVEPALSSSPYAFGAWEWQYAATRADAVPDSVLRAAAAVTVAVVDTGADLSAPDLASKLPAAYDTGSGGSDVSDTNGHGTFVAALAAGSVTNDEGVSGFGGDARLLVVRTASGSGEITDVEAARAIVYAVDRGARVINLSFGGLGTSATEQRAVDYAVERDVLLVAAAGNEYEDGNPVEYPAALLQPEGSNGQGGRGLVVGASTATGTRASFSNTGSWISLAAPGDAVFSALSSLSSPAFYPRVLLPGSRAGLYGFGSGTSFAAPQVAGAAALVRAIAPSLSAPDAARVLKETAQGGTWTPELGYGVLDVAGAVARAAELAGLPEEARAPSRASLSLAVSRAAGPAPLRLRVTATLHADAPASVAARRLELDSFDGRRWSTAVRGTTTAEGRRSWRFSLRRGEYRLRVRFAGARDLTAATSRPIRLLSR